MRYPEDHKEKARRSLLNAAGRAFRKDGFGGVGVDGIAQEGGVTSGAFYAHFRSKQEAFQETVALSLAQFRKGILRFREEAIGRGEDDVWFDDFATWYLSKRHRENVAGGCGMPSLTPEVARSDARTKDIFETGYTEAVRLLASLPPFAGASDALDRARAVVAILAGGTAMSRAARSERVATEIAASVRAAALEIARGPAASNNLRRSRPRKTSAQT